MRGCATAAVILWLLCVSPVLASITGSIAGTVKDPSGGLVPNAHVTVTETSTGATQSVTTDTQGGYSFLALAVGHYDLTVVANGFREYKQTGIMLNANDALRFDIPLEIGETSQSVEVNAATVQVETTETHVGDVIGGGVIQALPLNGRNFTDLLGLQPGVVPVSTGAVGNTQAGNLSISGQRETANGFEINGGMVEEAKNNGTAIIPNLDSIEEFRVLTNNPDPEYGYYAGGVVNVVSKSGTNDFHGSLFEFLRNEKLDARNFYDVNQVNPVTGQQIPNSAKGEFRRNQFGATLGGPVIRDKLFFFTDYQGSREVRGLSSGLVPVLTPAERNGDFSADAAGTFLANGTPVVGGGLAAPYFASVLSQRLGYTVTSGEPYYTAGCTSNTQCVFPNGIIPPAAFSPASKGLLQFIPLPNVYNANGAFFASTGNRQSTDSDRGSGRLDANTRLGMLSGYFFTVKSNQARPYGDNPIPGFPTANQNYSWYVNLGDVKTFSATAVNELHLALTRFEDKSDTPTSGLGVKLSQFGFVEGKPGGFIPADPKSEGVPDIGISGGPNFGLPGIVYDRFETNPQIRDNFSKVIGSHTMKFGAEWHYTNFVQQFPLVGGNGFVNFSGAETGSGFTDFLIGAPSGFTQESALNFNERRHYVGLFAQDSWRARPNLTVNYGVRWDYVEPWYERFDQRVTYVLGVQSKVFPTAPEGDLFPGDVVPGFGKIPPTISHTPKNNFAPRIGIAYSPSASGGLMHILFGNPGSTSIRASYGIFYTNIEGAQTYNSDPEPPYLVYYNAPVPPLFEAPLTNRTDGGINPIPLPFRLPHPGQLIDFTPYLPLAGEPALNINNVTPYAEHYFFGIQRQIGAKTLISASYVGSQGHHLLDTLAISPGNPQLCLSLPGCGPFGEQAMYTAPNGTVYNTTRGPFPPAFGDNYWVKTIGNSNYNALEASVRYRAGRLNLLASYTFSKSIDNASSYNDLTLNPTNYRLSRALSAFDVPHDFVLSYDYRLPFDTLAGSRWPRLTSGWALVGITRFASGFPVTITESDDRSLYGTLGSGIGGAIDEPDFAGGNLKITNPRAATTYFDTTLFSLEPLGGVGTSSHRFFHGPGIANYDMSLIKDLKITERISMQFRGEFFNVFNHAQFYNPNGNINSGSFGQVLSARDPRIGQVAAKLQF